MDTEEDTEEEDKEEEEEDKGIGGGGRVHICFNACCPSNSLVSAAVAAAEAAGLLLLSAVLNTSCLEEVGRRAGEAEGAEGAAIAVSLAVAVGRNPQSVPCDHIFDEVDCVTDVGDCDRLPPLPVRASVTASASGTSRGMPDTLSRVLLVAAAAAVTGTGGVVEVVAGRTVEAVESDSSGGDAKTAKD